MSRIDTTNRTAPNSFDNNNASDPAAAMIDKAPSALPDAKLMALQSSGDVGSMIAALLLEAGKASRDTARAARDAAIASEDAAHGRKIAHMKTAATERLVGGIASGAGLVAAGGAGVTGELSANAALANSPKAFEGGGTIAKAIGDFRAANEDIEVAHADRALTQAKRSVESADESATDAKDLLRRAMSYYADYVSAKDSAQKAALFRA